VVVSMPVVLYLGGYGVSVEQISALLMIVVILGLLLRRFLQAQRKREQLKKELEATRAVQQILIAKEMPEVPGFRIASAYKPAGLVGGDFFQLFRCERTVARSRDSAQSIADAAQKFGQDDDITVLTVIRVG
jgi:serine phosphatase RsbU (regulator of sigma subunit)